MTCTEDLELKVSPHWQVHMHDVMPYVSVESSGELEENYVIFAGHIALKFNGLYTFSRNIFSVAASSFT